jgi:hypothetical protein
LQGFFDACATAAASIRVREVNANGMDWHMFSVCQPELNRSNIDLNADPVCFQ